VTWVSVGVRPNSTWEVEDFTLVHETMALRAPVTALTLKSAGGSVTVKVAD
jgi:hypothetical protein